jgi:hypothetical protein
MTGNELAATIRKHKGPVFIMASFEPRPYVSAVKKDLSTYYSNKGSVEMCLKINAYPNSHAYVVVA